jgi:hypothetical protein
MSQKQKSMSTTCGYANATKANLSFFSSSSCRVTPAVSLALPVSSRLRVILNLLLLWDHIKLANWKCAKGASNTNALPKTPAKTAIGRVDGRLL